MMRYLIDKTPDEVTRKNESNLVRGQLLTPLTRYTNWGGEFAIDNGAFSRFDSAAFGRLIAREANAVSRCLFATCPDIVGAARRTLEIFQYRHRWIPKEFPVALVAQNGIEDLEIPWSEFECLFVGGIDPWKESQALADVVRAAKIMGKHIHIGRVNTPKRFNLFDALGADTCDGTGVSRYDHMLQKIEESRMPEQMLWQET